MEKAGITDARVLADAVLEDRASAPVSEADRKLYQAVEAFTAHPPRSTFELIDELHSAGWSDLALFEVISICALFNFFNTWVDASGSGGMSDAGCLASGARLAEGGYLDG